jgi:hypothetical protein
MPSSSCFVEEPGQPLAQKGEQLGLLGTIGAGEEDDELERAAHREVSESPELPSCSVPTHRRGKVAERKQDRGSPCSTQLSNIRAVRPNRAGDNDQ